METEDNDDNMETADNDDNMETEDNNNIDVTKLIQNNDNLTHFCEAFNNVDNSAYNSDCNSDDTDKDPDYFYNEDSESFDEENITTQLCPTESNNITKSSLETSLNVSGQKICDDINLHVECSKPRGTGKQNFCYYCKKMQSKISRHLERVHKNENEVQKFTALPKGTENMLLKYV